jgi:hypothetical protein
MDINGLLVDYQKEKRPSIIWILIGKIWIFIDIN